MTEPPQIGLIPLYVALYDQVAPQFRAPTEEFSRLVADRLTVAGLQIYAAPICCTAAEVEEAVADLTEKRVDLLATLHLAYSPSLEAADALAGSPLPLVLLDTTPSSTFGLDFTMDDMMRNHGIHGVQDLASVLRRLGRDYQVIAGHVDDPGFSAEIVVAAQAAKAAVALASMRVLVFGEAFEGMGDFAVEPAVLRSVLGLEAERVSIRELARGVAEVTDEALAAEAADDATRFDCANIPPDVLQTSHRVGLAIRTMLEQRGAAAFSANFQSFDRDLGVPTVHFLEASKSMARGIGYAGEGDALTAALVGALLQGFGDVTFAEMFCPDWEGEAIFMSHMGECNPALAADRPKLVEKEYAFGNLDNPAVALFPLQPGPATLVNLAPGPDDSFSLIAGRVSILDRALAPGFPDVPHFWIQPENRTLKDFLRRYSELGGTHHLALIMGERENAMRRMAAFMNVSFQTV